VEEYRFEVRLNWDRMQYYAVVNSAIIAVAAGLIGDADTTGGFLLCGTLFLIGLAMAAIGITAIHRGRDYYQATIFKKAVFEQSLGLNQVAPGLTNPKATFAIATTAGMSEVAAILAGKPRTPFWKRFVRNRVISYFMWFLMLLAVINIAGVTYVWSRLQEPKAPESATGKMTKPDPQGGQQAS
jgi:hypothetical protein